MQSDPRSPEPRLATLLALVGSIFGLTGVCVASYLAEDAARTGASGCIGADSTTGGSGCAGPALAPPGAHCGALTDLASPGGHVHVGRAASGRNPSGRVRVG